MSFLAGIAFRLFGVHEWIGRGKTVLFFAAFTAVFFLLVRRISGENSSDLAPFFYSFARVESMASRCFMPDVPSLSLAIIGLYCFLRWIADRQWRFFLASAIAISLSILIKAPSIVIGAPLLYMVVAAVYDRRRSLEGKVCDGHRPPLQALALFAAITLVPSAIWYWHAHQIAAQFYPYHFFGEDGIRIESISWYLRVAQMVITNLTPLLCVLGLIGLCVAPREKFGRVFHWWFVAMILFILIAGYGNRHPWYQLPLVPIVSAIAGAGYAAIALKISNPAAKIALSILAAGGFLLLAFVNVRAVYQPAAAQFRGAGLELKKITSPGSLVVAADNGNPTIFYYAERKGWHCPQKDGIWQGSPRDSEQAIIDLEQLRKRGAGYFVLLADTMWWLDYYPEFGRRLAIRADIIAMTDEFKIYKLHPANP